MGSFWARTSLRPAVLTNPSRKRSFMKTLFKPEEFENAGVSSKTELFENDSATTIIPDRGLLKHKSELTGNCYVFNSSGVVWTENIWWVFRVKPSFLNSFDVLWTENIWWVFRVKPSFSNSSGIEWTVKSETFVFKFLRRSVDGKHLMSFQSETFVFKFLQRGVDGKEWDLRF